MAEKGSLTPSRILGTVHQIIRKPVAVPLNGFNFYCRALARFGCTSRKFAFFRKNLEIETWKSL